VKAHAIEPGLLEDARKLTDRLVGRGLSAAAAAPKARLFQQCQQKMAELGGEAGAQVFAFYVPGRVEVLGKHTDYAGGRSLLMAAEYGFCLIARRRADRRMRIVPAEGGSAAQFDLSGELVPPIGQWCNYPMTAARRIARNFQPPLAGADIVFASDLPMAAGMSSSSAMIVAFFLAISAVNDLSGREEYQRNISSGEDLAGYLGTVENGQSFRDLAGDRGVGTFGGSGDHTAILCCQSGRLSQYSYCPIRFERAIALPEGHVLAVASSGVAAEKTGAALEKYNAVSGLARAAVEAWNRATGRNDAHLAAAAAGAGDAAAIQKALAGASCASFTPEQLARRAEQFAAESLEIIPQAGDALARGDLSEFGRCVRRSHQLADQLLGNQVAETNFLVASAEDCGALAASAFGAGFGGAVWAMVGAGDVQAMLAQWSGRYFRQFPSRQARAAFFSTGAGPAAFFL
jgi:galactokinase